MTLVLSKAYSSNLLSALTKQVTQPHINTIDELYHSKEHEVLLLPGGFELNHFNIFIRDNFRKVYSKFKGRFAKFGLDKKLFMERPSSVLLRNMESYDLHIKQSWGLPAGKTFVHYSSEVLAPVLNGIAMQTGFKLKGCIDVKILKSQEAGLWYKWREDAISAFRREMPVAHSEKRKMAAFMATLPHPDDQKEPLSMEQMQTAFYVYLGIITLAGFAFILEQVAPSLPFIVEVLVFEIRYRK